MFENNDENQFDTSDVGNDGSVYTAPVNSEDEIEIDNNKSQVASAPGRNIVIFVVLAVVSVAFLYFTVFKEDEAQVEKQKVAEIIESQPVENAEPATQETAKPDVEVGVVDAPELPDVPSVDVPPPPSSSAESQIEVPDPFGGFSPEPVAQKPEPVFNDNTAEKPVIEPEKPKDEFAGPEETDIAKPSLPLETAVVTGPTPEEIAAQKATRRKAEMVVVNGGGQPSDVIAKLKDNAIRAVNSVDDLARTEANQVVATNIGNTDYMVAQGKMIDAVLETAINTDLPGALRAIVSRDIYAESGRAILIPKGSRLIGEYDSSIKKGQSRVLVKWNRIIRPDGIDIMVDSPGTDPLGRAGVGGIVDNKYFEVFSNAILLSAVSIAGALLYDKVENSQSTTNSTTTSTDGNTTSSQSGNPADLAVLDAVENVSNVGEDLIGDLAGLKPTIYVHQGTRIKVFVNRDLIFPKTDGAGVTFIK